GPPDRGADGVRDRTPAVHPAECVSAVRRGRWADHRGGIARGSAEARGRSVPPAGGVAGVARVNEGGGPVGRYRGGGAAGVAPLFAAVRLTAGSGATVGCRRRDLLATQTT